MIKIKETEVLGEGAVQLVTTKELELITKTKKGDDSAFYELISTRKTQLYRMALTYLKNEEDALEAIQEVTYRAYKKLKKLRQPELFQTWLIRILINYCHDEWKRKKRMAPTTDSIQPITSEPKSVDKEMRMTLHQSIDQLKSHYRDVIILKFFEDMTVPQIAEVIEKPEGTVKTWLRRALQELKIELREEDFYG
ncbi:MAG: RNA polymerase sigma factor [Bacillus sp. (in: Bacteria)]|nr:RNA polymerase sigma factor [Bacillus sp. (in: firmicutes)]